MCPLRNFWFRTPVYCWRCKIPYYIGTGYRRWYYYYYHHRRLYCYAWLYIPEPSWKTSKKTAVLRGRKQWWLDSSQPLRRKISRNRFGENTRRVWCGEKEIDRDGEFGTEPPPLRKTIKPNTNAYPVFRRAWFVWAGSYNNNIL